jgi:hypothetical protein
MLTLKEKIVGTKGTENMIDRERILKDPFGII